MKAFIVISRDDLQLHCSTVSCQAMNAAEPMIRSSLLSFSNTFKATDLSRWMDYANGHYGGFYHRVWHGHDVLVSTSAVYNRFGLKGLLNYPYELFKDFITPHGLPIPGIEAMVKQGFLSARIGTLWFSISATDLLSGLFAFWSCYEIRRKLRSGNSVRTGAVIVVIVVFFSKVYFGIISGNPLLLAAAVCDSFHITSFALKHATPSLRKFETVISTVVSGALGWSLWKIRYQERDQEIEQTSYCGQYN